MAMALDIDTSAPAAVLRKLARTMPKAKAAAFARAGAAALSQAATEIADKAGVPRWMVLGTGGATRSKGGRIGRTGYRPKYDGIFLVLRHAHINPVGTKHKKNKVTSTLKARTKKARKAGAGPRPISRVRVIGRTYDGAYFAGGPYGGGIYEAAAGQARGQLQAIDLDPWALPMLYHATRRVAPPVFGDRLRHELKRRCPEAFK